MFNQWKVLWQNALVDIVELLHLWSAKMEHFSCGYLETALQNEVDKLTGLVVSDDMWLDNAKTAVVQLSRCAHWLVLALTTEEELDFSHS